MTELVASALSIGIEAAVAPVLTAALVPPADRRHRAIVAAGVAAAGTLLTHPAVWYGALALYPRIGVAPTLVLVEVGAVLAEAALYCIVLPPSRALVVSFGANAASALLGAWLTW